ncbi:MAG: hypothetical protein WDN09_01935 [bacterium]
MSNTPVRDYSGILSDKNAFNQAIYTPLSEALRLLEERRNDPDLVAKVEEILKGDIPEFFRSKKCGVFARQLATPNFDTRRFVKITKENGLETVLFEYPEDKFTSNNAFKHSLSQIRINSGFNKNGNDLLEKINIIDMVKNDGKKLKDIATLWGEPLIDFHRKLFTQCKLPEDLIFYDISEWFHRNGPEAVKFYRNYLLLFVTHGILFENYLTNGREGAFSKDVVLPAIEEITELTGAKPLIVPLSLMDMEDEEYWISHMPEVKNFIPKI